MSDLEQLKKVHTRAAEAQRDWWVACEAWSDAFRLNATPETLERLAKVMDSTQLAYLDAAGTMQTLLGFYLEGKV